MKYRLIICLLILAGLSANAAFADNALQPTISSGGTVQTGFQDIKGEPVIGKSTDGTLLLGGIYTMGGGTVATPEVPAGTAKLYISRDSNNNDIDITWEVSKYGTSPQIFVMTGDGTGMFQNTYDANVWKLYSDSSNGAGTFDNSSMSTGKIVNKNQIGAGTTEVYYKGLTAGTVVADRLPSAEAVGKINYNFVHGNNYFNYPFISTGEADYIFGANGYVQNSAIYNYQKSTDDFGQILFDGSRWPAMKLVLGKGYVFYNQGNQITATLVGTISRNTDRFSFTVDETKNYLGLPVAGKLTLGQSFGSNPAANDVFYYYKHDTDDFGQVLSTNGTVFDNASYLMIPKIGYVYYRNNSAATFNWQPQQIN